MADTPTERENLRDLIDRMVTAREAMNVQRDLLHEYRQEARSEGLNMQALNPLIEILGENGHDRGSRALKDLFEYASLVGAELDHPRTPTNRGNDPGGMETEEAAKPDLAATRPKTAAPSGTASPRRRVLGKGIVQVSLAILVSLALVWLLN